MFAKDESVKIVTFSFDDGVNNDLRLANLLRRYRIKATFNLNSGLMSHEQCWDHDGQKVFRLTPEEAIKVYAGFEIASHGKSHAFLSERNEEETEEEIVSDVLALSYLFKQEIKGFATPFGPSNAYVDRILRKSGIAWCRGVKSTRSFDVPKDLLHFEPSAHFADPFLDELVDRFIKMEPHKKEVLFIWGHSYELDSEEKWTRLEKLLKTLSDEASILKFTNSEALL